jgi:hypothetical protein
MVLPTDLVSEHKQNALLQQENENNFSMGSKARLLLICILRDYMYMYLQRSW